MPPAILAILMNLPAEIAAVQAIAANITGIVKHLSDNNTDVIPEEMLADLQASIASRKAVSAEYEKMLEDLT